MNLSDKVALVTGSTSGIGLGIARAFAAAGANVMLNGFGDKALIDKLLAEFESKYKIRAAHSAADMSKPAEIAEMVAHAARELGGVDILVNNAGIQHVAPVEEFPLEKWDAVIAINLSAAFHAIRAALPNMKARNWGRIINIASTHGLVASAQKAAYVAAKHGILGLTKVVALETATSGSHVQRDLPRLGADAACAEADRRSRCAGKDRSRCRKGEAARRKAAVARVRHTGANRRRSAFPVLCRRRADPRHRAAGRRWLDRPMSRLSIHRCERESKPMRLLRQRFAAAVFVLSLAALGWLGREIYFAAPPIPEVVRAESGETEIRANTFDAGLRGIAMESRP